MEGTEIDPKSFARGLAIGMDVAMGFGPDGLAHLRLEKLLEAVNSPEVDALTVEESAKAVCKRFFVGPEGPCDMARGLKSIMGHKVRPRNTELVLITVAKLATASLRECGGSLEETQSVLDTAKWLCGVVDSETAADLQDACGLLV